MKTILVLSFCCVGMTSIFAEEKTPPPKSEYKPQAKSAFNKTGIGRNPFEPIGYVAGKKDPVEADIPVCTPDMFRVSTIIVGSPGIPSVAVINGKDYEPGKRVPVPGQNISVTVISVTDGQVILQHPDPRVGNKGRVVIKN